MKATVHTLITGCGLTRQDFHPCGEERCPDGGTPDEHPDTDEEHDAVRAKRADKS